MFDIITSRDFLEKLEGDFADFSEAPHSTRLALNCAMTAYHLHEWVWGEWLKNQSAGRPWPGFGANRRAGLDDRV